MFVVFISSALFIVAVVAAVFVYIAYYDYFVSCEPNNAVLYLVLSILIPVTLPFFIFFSRKKDDGMPPRRDAQPVAEPVQESPKAEEEP